MGQQGWQGLFSGSIASALRLLRIAAIALTAAMTIGQGAALQAQATVDPYGTYLPLVGADIRRSFNTGYVERCVPNNGIMYVNGTTAYQGAPVSGQMVAFSYEPDGPIVAKVQSGPHPGYPNWDEGFFSHILGIGLPVEVDWHFWIVDGHDQRISVIVYLHTDGWQGVDACQQAVIRFDNR
jgi:hypothetical protein